MHCLTHLTLVLWAGASVVYAQSPVRCFDCNSGGTGFGMEICPPNGNLKQELLTTVRCSERCFSRTMIEKPGVVQRGCSAGIGFFLSRPLPEDGCVQVANKNWWCFCSESFCNVDDMTRFGEDGLLPLDEEPVVSKDETSEPWTQPRTQPVTRRTTTTTTMLPEPEAEPTAPLLPPGDQRRDPPRESEAVDTPEVEMEEPPREIEENLQEPSYEEPLETWEERPFVETDKKNPSHSDGDSRTESPADRHYTRHTHGHDEDTEDNQYDMQEPSEQAPLALP